MQEEDPLPQTQSGALRNSLGPASPWLTPSASPSPMSCTSRSENRFTGCMLSAATVDLLVVNEGVWHSAHPVLVKRLLLPEPPVLYTRAVKLAFGQR